MFRSCANMSALRITGSSALLVCGLASAAVAFWLNANTEDVAAPLLLADCAAMCLGFGAAWLLGAYET